MVDVKNQNLMRGVVDSIANPVLTAPSAPLPLKGWLQRGSDDPWTMSQWAADELPCRESGARRKAIGERSTGARGENDPEGFGAINLASHEALVHVAVP